MCTDKYGVCVSHTQIEATPSLSSLSFPLRFLRFPARASLWAGMKNRRPEVRAAEDRRSMFDYSVTRSPVSAER